MAENCVNYLNRGFSEVVGVLAILANLVLGLLVRNQTPLMMHGYRKVLYGSCVLDGLAALSHLLIVVRPSMESDVAITNFDGVLPQIIDSFGVLPEGNLAYLIVIEFFFQLNTLSYCFVPFTYRYFHIVRKTNLTKTQFLLLILLYLWPTTVLAISLPTMAAKSFGLMTEFLGPATKTCLRRIPFFDPRFASIEPIKGFAFSALFSLFFTFIFPFFLCYFLFKIFKKLNEDVQKVSASASRMQRQITMTLTAQSVVPLIFVALPTFYAAHNLFHNKEKTLSLRIFFNSLSVVPLINPLTTLFMVKNYRNTLLRALRISRFQRKTTTTSVLSKATITAFPMPLDPLRSTRSF
ncbi:unnamed protein product [Bursaphelenchus xylophilus]|uniref:(pine wood nematode) hypothetical protein n=1 Tax=Bursaphelenchus xylophilus TaxID=6326 RepID=A0A7I8XLS6_BURXY|nr:unnamed protein product [Bursaphelenchus xylophilus]CAG9090167.1 unnamed protein product [Bursaphelenchus xylophilus]